MGSISTIKQGKSTTILAINIATVCIYCNSWSTKSFNRHAIYFARRTLNNWFFCLSHFSEPLRKWPALKSKLSRDPIFIFTILLIYFLSLRNLQTYLNNFDFIVLQFGCKRRRPLTFRFCCGSSGLKIKISSFGLLWTNIPLVHDCVKAHHINNIK